MTSTKGNVVFFKTASYIKHVVYNLISTSVAMVLKKMYVLFMLSVILLLHKTSVNELCLGKIKSCMWIQYKYDIKLINLLPVRSYIVTRYLMNSGHIRLWNLNIEMPIFAVNIFALKYDHNIWNTFSIYNYRKWMLKC